MDVDVARVTRREPGMNPVEVMTSESQERMLAIVRPTISTRCSRSARGGRSGRRWSATVTDTGRFRVYDGMFDALGVPGGEPAPARRVRRPRPVSSDRPPIADVPVGSLGDGPSYDRPVRRPAEPGRARSPTIPRPCSPRGSPPAPTSPASCSRCSRRPTIADKSWISRQYDHQLFLNTVVGPGRRRRGAAPPGHAARPRAQHRRQGPVRARSIPRTGGRLAVLEAARNVVCAGARPLALVNCLNFGNPEHPEVMWQFAEVVDGMSEACRALDLPVIGGNVSFYNESRGADIDPTPVVGVIGLIDELDACAAGGRVARRRPRSSLLGETRRRARWLGVGDDARPPRRRAARRRPRRRARAARARRGLVVERVVDGVHDCSDGGLAVALAEMAIAGDVGFQVAVGDALALLLRVGVAGRALGRSRPRRRRASRGPPRPGCRSPVIGDAGGDRLVADGRVRRRPRRGDDAPGATRSRTRWVSALERVRARARSSSARVARAPGRGGPSPCSSSHDSTCAADAATERSLVDTWISGASGGSYGSDTPVNSGISPARAFVYRPFTSRSSHTSSGVSTNTSTKFGISARTASRVSRYGEIAAVIAATPLRARTFATQPIRRMLMSRSALENVEARRRGARGPRRRRAARPGDARLRSSSATTFAIVLLPGAGEAGEPEAEPDVVGHSGQPTRASSAVRPRVRGGRRADVRYLCQ